MRFLTNDNSDSSLGGFLSPFYGIFGLPVGGLPSVLGIDVETLLTILNKENVGDNLIGVFEPECELIKILLQLRKATGGLGGATGLLG